MQPPRELTKFTPTVSVQRVWKEGVGDGAKDSGVRMRPAYDGGVLFVASTDGVIKALDAKTGKTLWRNKGRTHGLFGWGERQDRKDVLLLRRSRRRQRHGGGRHARWTRLCT